MRRWLQKPGLIVVLALLAQILAPIGGVWSASARAADPFAAIPLCSGLIAHEAGGGDAALVDHSTCCPLCAVAHTGSLPEPPATGLVLRAFGEIAWADHAGPTLVAQARGSAQARAPPSDV